jgi:hypothetical protein
MSTALERYLRLRDHLTDDFLGGPRVKFAWAINLQKGGTVLFVLAMMSLYDCWTTTAWVYLGLHGSYGLIWLLKEAVFPDPGWQKRITLAGALNAWLFVLGPYWIAPWLIASQRIEQPPAVLGVAVLVYALGVALMVGADAQKYFVLRAPRPDRRWFLRAYAQSELSRRDDDLRQFRRARRALAAVDGAGLGLARRVRTEHAAQGGEHGALPGMGGLQGAYGFVVAAMVRSCIACGIERAGLGRTMRYFERHGLGEMTKIEFLKAQLDDTHARCARDAPGSDARLAMPYAIGPCVAQASRIELGKV